VGGGDQGIAAAADGGQADMQRVMLSRLSCLSSAAHGYDIRNSCVHCLPDVEVVTRAVLLLMMEGRQILRG